MKLIIYDYQSRPVELELEDKPIKFISVLILSGDEVVDVIYEDGVILSSDASDAGESRLLSCYDGRYFLTKPEQIESFLNFKPSGKAPASDERMDMFISPWGDE